MEKDLVYVGMVGDLLHAGHINVLEKAKSLGRVVVGVLTDSAVAGYKRLPFLSFEERVNVVKNINGVEKVIAQTSLSYRENLLELRPKYVVHGDDWRYSNQQSSARQEVIHLLKLWGGELVEIPYTVGVSSTLINQAFEEDGLVARVRQGKLCRMLEAFPMVRVLEAHNALAAIIASNTSVEEKRFHALWQSSFTDSAQRGKPDIEIVDHHARLATINEIFDASALPLIYDGDTGGQPEKVFELAKSLDRAGVSALCLEDKMGAKKNSLYGQSVEHQQAPIALFRERIRAAKKGIGSGQMMFIARIESLVMGLGQVDALERAEAYLDAGADAILIHSVSRSADEIALFCGQFRKRYGHVPIFVVPTTYGRTPENELRDAGVNAIIYANHMLRAAYPAKVSVAQHILAEGKSDDEHLQGCLASTKTLLDLFPQYS